MRMSHVLIRPGLVVGLCMVILGVSVCLPLASAEVGSPTGSLPEDQPPARPVYGPPGPRPDQTVPGVATPTPTLVSVPVPQAPQAPVSAPLPLEPPTPSAPLRPLTCGLLADFEQFGTWKRGDEPYGTFAQAFDQVYSGSYSGQLSYGFPTGGNDYVVFRRTIPMGGAGMALTAWVYGDNSGHFLNAWVKDAGGEIWSFPFGQIKHTGWQQMTAPLDVLGDWPTTHISGPANLVLDHPINFHAFVLDDIPDTYSGSGVIYIDDLSCSDVVLAPPAGPAQAPVGPAQAPVGSAQQQTWPPQGQNESGCVVTLLEPAEGAQFGPETDTVTLRWQFNRALAPQEYFFVNVEFPHGGQTWFDGTWRDPGQQLPDGTLDTSWPLRDYLCGPGFSDTGWYKWWVTVLHQLGPQKSLSDGFVCRSDKRNFKWSGCQPTPTPRPAGEYDLYVRRMDFTPANPVAGQNIDMTVMIATDIRPDSGPYFPASHFHWRPKADAGWKEESCPDNAQYATCVKTITFSYNQPGSYDVKVEADNRHEVDETNEANNDKKWTINVN